MKKYFLIYKRIQDFYLYNQKVVFLSEDEELAKKTLKQMKIKFQDLCIARDTYYAAYRNQWEYPKNYLDIRTTEIEKIYKVKKEDWEKINSNVENTQFFIEEIEC